MGKVAVALALLALAPQTGPPGGPPPPPGGTGVILGKVVDAISNAPVAGVIVGLLPAGAPGAPVAQPRSVLTDSQGRFVFRNLAAGSYTLPTRMGGNGFAPSGFVTSGQGQPIAPYLLGGYGARRPGGPLQPIDLADGARITDALIHMWKGGAVEGTVLDEANEPVVGVTVAAVRRTTDGRLLNGPTVTTDDRGGYHLGTLVPGQYVIVVPQIPALMPTVLSGRFVYQATFYPSAVSSGDARAVAVAAGETRGGLDIRLQPVPGAEVSGSLSDGSAPVPRLALHLEPVDRNDGASAIEAASVTSDAEGLFTFPLVPAGQYVLWSQRGALSPRGGGPGIAVPPVSSYARPSDASGAWASQTITVSDQPVRGISLLLRPPVQITGRVEFRGSGAQPTPDQLQRLLVTVAGIDSRARTPPPIGAGRVDSSGRFSGAIVMPGRHIIRVPDTPAWHLESVTLSGTDVTDTPVVVGDADISDVVVTLTDHTTELRGTVQNARGEPDPTALVVLFPVNEGRWSRASVQTRAFLSARTSKDGTFVMRALLPGDYFVAAVPDDDAAAWPDEAFLRRVAPLATRHVITVGNTQTLSLRTGIIR